ncbi:DUF4158 domain-containing protein [Nonomuraea sp. NPDC046802]|uniref:DUF4158 domain-containing protein n=1 Tax=Nonomuraea sp. NPDC046802 TaxID=3154919 RepID=UPI0033DEA7AE
MSITWPGRCRYQGAPSPRRARWGRPGMPGGPMPVSFLTSEQRSRYGVFNAVPDIAQLGAFFHLDTDDRRRAMAANGARNQLGWLAVQLDTARFLNCFLDHPEDVPAVVVDYVAEQLGLQAAESRTRSKSPRLGGPQGAARSGSC